MFYIPGATLFSFLIPSQSLEILSRYMNSLLNPPPLEKRGTKPVYAPEYDAIYTSQLP